MKTYQAVNGTIVKCVFKTQTYSFIINKYFYRCLLFHIWEDTLCFYKCCVERFGCCWRPLSSPQQWLSPQSFSKEKAARSATCCRGLNSGFCSLHRRPSEYIATISTVFFCSTVCFGFTDEERHTHETKVKLGTFLLVRLRLTPVSRYDEITQQQWHCMTRLVNPITSLFSFISCASLLKMSLVFWTLLHPDNSCKTLVENELEVDVTGCI